MVAILGVVAGLAIGAGLAWALSLRRHGQLVGRLSGVQSELAVRDAQLALAQENFSRAREEHDAALANLEVTFENMSNRVLAQTVTQFNQSQEQVLRERDSKLHLTLKPLEVLLEDYKRDLSEFDKQHASALSDVKFQASKLLEEQVKTQEETRRLNQLLGRGDQRGHWGEVQLANVMEASGLRRGIDFDLQVTGVNDAGRALRPDCVVKMPNGTSIAVDAKFPFDRFEAALAADDVERRRTLYEEHAKALRGHVKTLKEKAYWEVITPAPEFVVCFVPSDFAITTAFEADAGLHAFAVKERVLIVGPTNLLSLLWSVAMVVRQYEATLNSEKILKVAEEIYDRIRIVAEPISKMGKSLNDTVENYNKMVRSVESRLVTSAHRLRRLGGASLGAKPLADFVPVHELARPLDGEKWGVGPANSLSEGDGEILDLEAIEGEWAAEGP